MRTSRWLLGSLVLAACGSKPPAPAAPHLGPGQLACGTSICHAGQYCVTSREIGGHDSREPHDPYTTTACEDTPPADNDPSKRCTTSGRNVTCDLFTP